jgi:hypothetical protein
MSELSDHSSWLASQLAKEVAKVWVDTPLEVKGSGMLASLSSSYITYSVSTPTTSARHRYSDFEKLHATLHARYGLFGLLVPSLPKKLMKNVVIKGQAFHFQRMRGLTIFCEAVGSNPYLKDDEAWTQFLVPDAAVVVESNPLPPAPVRWMQAVEAGATPENSGELITQLKKETMVVVSSVDVLLAKAKTLVTSITATSAAVGAMEGALNDWSESETNDIDQMNALSTTELTEGGGSSSVSVPNTLVKGKSLLTSQFGAMVNSGDHINILFSEALEYETSQMSDFYALSKYIANIVAQNDKLERDLVKLQVTATAKMDDYKLSKHKDGIDAAQKTLDGGRVYLDLYIRAICLQTLPALSIDRKMRVKTLILNLGSCLHAISSSASKGCSSFFKSMDVEEPKELANDCCAVLEALGLPPLAEVGGGGEAAAAAEVVA